MCRNIKRLHNLAPPATPDEIRESALQYVRKVSGMPKPSAANQPAFDAAVDRITAIMVSLIHEELVTKAPPRDRADEAARARDRGRKRTERLRARVLAELEAQAES